jgi:dihydropteroate synthase
MTSPGSAAPTGPTSARPDDGSPPLPALGVPPRGTSLVLRGRTLDRPAVMAILNRTDDSFYAAARQLDDRTALTAVERAVAEGAEILDVGGVRAGVGPEVTPAEEVRRVVPFVARVRAEFPDLLVSVDTWRAEVAHEAALAGADLINDTWAGHDPRLVEVAGEHGVGVVCSHTGGATPRTDPFRVDYPARPGAADPRDGVVQDVVATLRAAAERAVSCGVPRASVLVDPTHDFGKNTWHSLHLLRRTEVLAGLGFPLLMALSRKDFVGETLDLPADERLEGTLAATALAAWLGARVFRAHDVAATRRVLDLVAAVRDEVPPAAALRGLA